MTMTKGDFEAVATTIRNQARAIRAANKGDTKTINLQVGLDTLRGTAHSLARDFLVSNERFNQELFFEACGMEKFWPLAGFTNEDVEHVWNFRPTETHPVQEYK